MPIRFKCSACGRIIEVSKSAAGETVTCASCGLPLSVPMPKPDASDPLAQLAAAIASTDEQKAPPEEEKAAPPEPEADEKRRQRRQAAREEKREPAEKRPEAKPRPAEAPPTKEPKAPRAPEEEKPSAAEHKERPAAPSAARPAEQPARVVRVVRHRAPGNAGYGAMALLMLAAAIGAFFVPWTELILARVGAASASSGIGDKIYMRGDLNLMLVKVSPASFIIKMGKYSDATGQTPQQAGDKPAAAGKSAEENSLATFLLVDCPFAYGVGLVVGVVGAFQMLTRWRSIPMVFGFLICLIGCIMALLGLALYGSEEMLSKGVQAAEGVVRVVITPWFYAAAVVTVLGLATSTMAMTRRPGRRST